MTPNHSLIAQLPKIGPLLGWTSDRSGRSVARLWAKAEDAYSGRAVLALTAVWDGAKAKDVRFWRVHPIHLPGTEPPVLERFALAEVELPPAPLAVRMVMLHIREKIGDDDLPSVYGRAYHFESLDAPEDFVLPEAQAVRPDEFAPRLMDGAGLSDADYAAELFRELEAELEARQRVGSAPIPGSLSRRYRQVPSIAQCEVRPALRPEGSPLFFAAGSCRHPGVGFDRARTDAALSGIAERARDGLDLALMLGDQIYVDAAAGVLDGEDRLEKFALRYDAAFASPGFRALASKVPTYMLADDHEVRDGWPNDSLPAKQLFWDTPVEWAWRLFLAHQRWHAPARPRWASRPRVSRYSFWYSFEQRGYPFFAFDARFERRPGGEHIVGREQMAAFKTWLAHVAREEKAGVLEPHVPKFVLSGSVFVPGLEEFGRHPERVRRADNWQGFPADQAKVARLVAESGVQNLVFLSGDYHCAAVGGFDFGGARGYAIVAPPFYAPYPFANALERDIAAKQTLADGKGSIGSCSAKACGLQGFALVRARRERLAGKPEDWEIDVELYSDSDARAPARKALLAGGAADWSST
jgi:hypothetical protein